MQFALPDGLAKATSGSSCVVTLSRVAEWYPVGSAGAAASIHVMTSAIAAPEAGGFAGAVDGVGVFEIVGFATRVLVGAVVNTSWDRPAVPGVVDEHAATSADVAIRTTIRIPARLSARRDASGEARRPDDLSLTSW